MTASLAVLAITVLLWAAAAAAAAAAIARRRCGAPLAPQGDPRKAYRLVRI